MLAVPGLGAAPETIASPTLVSIDITDQDRLNSLTGYYDVWTVNREQGFATVLLHPDEYTALRKAGYRMTIIRELGGGIRAMLDPRFYYYDASVPNAYNRYLTQWLQDTNQSHPQLTELLDVGDSWEAKNGGYHRDTWVLRISNEISTFGPIRDKPAFFLFANVHAREVAVPEIAIRYAEYLLNGHNGSGGYGVDADTTWLVDHHVTYLLIMQNPDGHGKTETDIETNWRKNNDNDDACDDPLRWGVDLNRNHSFKWGCCFGSSPYPCASTYRGPSAASEPETQAFEHFFTRVMKDQNGPNGNYEVPPAAPDDATGIFVSLHSFGNLILWPFAFDPDQTPNRIQLETIGRKLSHTSGYAAEGFTGNMSGATDDWTYGKFGIASFTFEVGPTSGACLGFFPPYECLDDGLDGPSFWSQVGPALHYAQKIARTPYLTTYGPDTLNPTITTRRSSSGDRIRLTGVIEDRRLEGDPLMAITAAEFFIGRPGKSGTGTPMVPSDGTWGDVREQVQAEIMLGEKFKGMHYILVHGMNSAGKWGPFTATWLRNPLPD